MSWAAHQSQKTWFKLPAWGWAYNPTVKDLESGDKLILHSGILHALMQRFGEKPLPHPLVFEIQNMKNKRMSHCGVLEFSSAQSTAFLPNWMMSNLALENGDEIQLKLKELPKITKLSLQPLKWTFADIATPKLALEHALRAFTALTVGDTISIKIGLVVHQLIISDLKPDTKHVGQKNAACVVDAPHVEVDFLPPLEVEPEHLKPVELTLGESKMLQQSDADAYKYYRIKNIDGGMALRIQIAVKEGDPELVVSTSTNKPDLSHCTWKSVGSSQNQTQQQSTSSTGSTASSSNQGNTKAITIQPNSLGFITGWYYIGVYAYKSPAVFDVNVSEVPPSNEAPSAGIAGVGAGKNLGSLSAADPNAKLCPTCHQYVAVKSYSLHSAQCARINVYCDVCEKTIRKSEEKTHTHCIVCKAIVRPEEMEKHMALLHEKVNCPDCGESVEPNALLSHKSQSCSSRGVQCKYCHMEMAFKLLQEHESFCGATSDICERCSKPVARRRMDIHMAVDHGVNLSLKPGDKNSMGTSKKALSSAEIAAQQKALSQFTQREKEDPNNPKPPAPAASMNEDEALAFAIRQSMESAGIEPINAHHDDPMLQQALLESQMGASSSSSATFAAPASSAAGSHAEADEDDDFNDGDHMEDEEEHVVEEEEEDTWDDDDAPKPASGQEQCPYCNKICEGMAGLEKHMETCDQID